MSVYMIHIEWLRDAPDTIEVVTVSTDGTTERTHVATVAEADALCAAALANFDTDRTAAINAMIAELEAKVADLEGHLPPP
jgi:acyl-CoA reductase-like NAD-dependent aldehyde dehydrogenase